MQFEAWMGKFSWRETFVQTFVTFEKEFLLFSDEQRDKEQERA